MGFYATTPPPGIPIGALSSYKVGLLDDASKLPVMRYD